MRKLGLPTAEAVCFPEASLPTVVGCAAARRWGRRRTDGVARDTEMQAARQRGGVQVQLLPPVPRAIEPPAQGSISGAGVWRGRRAAVGGGGRRWAAVGSTH